MLNITHTIFFLDSQDSRQCSVFVQVAVNFILLSWVNAKEQENKKRGNKWKESLSCLDNDLKLYWLW